MFDIFFLLSLVLNFSLLFISFLLHFYFHQCYCLFFLTFKLFWQLSLVAFSKWLLFLVHCLFEVIISVVWIGARLEWAKLYCLFFITLFHINLTVIIIWVKSLYLRDDITVPRWLFINLLDWRNWEILSKQTLLFFILLLDTVKTRVCGWISRSFRLFNFIETWWWWGGWRLILFLIFKELILVSFWIALGRRLIRSMHSFMF